jgi:hypothetical protein
MPSCGHGAYCARICGMTPARLREVLRTLCWSVPWQRPTTFTIITTDAKAKIAELHDRIPVVLYGRILDVVAKFTAPHLVARRIFILKRVTVAEDVGHAAVGN